MVDETNQGGPKPEGITPKAPAGNSGTEQATPLVPGSADEAKDAGSTQQTPHAITGPDETPTLSVAERMTTLSELSKERGGMQNIADDELRNLGYERLSDGHIAPIGAEVKPMKLAAIPPNANDEKGTLAAMSEDLGEMDNPGYVTEIKNMVRVDEKLGNIGGIEGLRAYINERNEKDPIARYEFDKTGVFMREGVMMFMEMEKVKGARAAGRPMHPLYINGLDMRAELLAKYAKSETEPEEQRMAAQTDMQETAERFYEANRDDLHQEYTGDDLRLVTPMLPGTEIFLNSPKGGGFELSIATIGEGGPREGADDLTYRSDNEGVTSRYTKPNIEVRLREIMKDKSIPESQRIHRASELAIKSLGEEEIPFGPINSLEARFLKELIQSSSTFTVKDMEEPDDEPPGSHQMS